MIRNYYFAADSHQYAAWNRTRRIRATPYLARTETNTSRTATALATGLASPPPATNNPDMNLTEPPNDKRQETLFGPSIGIVGDGPAWAQSDDEKKTTSDYLTPEIVKRWIETSKESIQPTTTLQALVNLKRPTLRLSPLAVNPSDDPVPLESHNNHALEFEYDCDAPKCSITVQVIVSSGEPSHSSPSTQRITVYYSVFDGGFGRSLKLEDGATIELGRFDQMAHGTPVVNVGQSSPKIDKELITTEIIELPELSSQPNALLAPTLDSQENARKRRFTALHFRRRSQNRSLSGPALAVVDNDTQATTEDGEKEKDAQSDDGVRVVIKLVALDDLGKELPSVNRQSTYLHVVRLGSPVTDGEDNKPWVVKVVKREATIGPYTFHLHEIYGLSSATAQPTVPTTPDTHTYPPGAATPVEDEPSSECLVCLSSPREVVLLPCRHLVACKECAINMIEFGAGGAIMHTDEPIPPEPAGAGDGAPATSSLPASAPAATVVSTPATPTPNAPLTTPTPTPQNPRRKRRGKGWFCPVCRQPYTSLLRITTIPPTMEGGKEVKRVSTSTIDYPLVMGAVTNTNPTPVAGLAVPTPVLEPTPEEPTLPTTPPRSLRPNFLRRLSRRAADPVSPV
ncbi:hypothetical protein B0F90DRAFT_1632368 [Multifurca ochricompacta]|uniref:RING-type domain-containing protein n=1 Tax=Multifurca ochricompacta TaxID=376703 RepID=A0AAD4M1N6_9AGAM|nr:hypothetical protein B0F90DRAFT_1632368 [Multifurca ochricompacta]